MLLRPDRGRTGNRRVLFPSRPDEDQLARKRLERCLRAALCLSDGPSDTPTVVDTMVTSGARYTEPAPPSWCAAGCRFRRLTPSTDVDNEFCLAPESAFQALSLTMILATGNSLCGGARSTSSRHVSPDPCAISKAHVLEGRRLASERGARVGERHQGTARPRCQRCFEAWPVAECQCEHCEGSRGIRSPRGA